MWAKADNWKHKGFFCSCTSKWKSGYFHLQLLSLVTQASELPTHFSFCVACCKIWPRVVEGANQIFSSFLSVAAVSFSPKVMLFITALSQRSPVEALHLIEMTFSNTETAMSHKQLWPCAQIHRAWCAHCDLKLLIEVMSTVYPWCICSIFLTMFCKKKLQYFQFWWLRILAEMKAI